MICSCGKENEIDTRFCSDCGIELKSTRFQESNEKVNLMIPKKLFNFTLIWPILGSIILIFQIKKLKTEILPYILISISIFLFDFGLIPLITMLTNDFFIGHIISLIPRMIINLIIALVIYKNYKKIFVSNNKELEIKKLNNIFWRLAVAGLVIGIITIPQFISQGGSLTTAIYGQNPIKFGRYSTSGSINDRRKTFSVLDNTIYCEFDFQGGNGGGNIYIFLEDTNSNKIVYNSGEIQIPPDWSGVVYELDNPGYNGDFILKVVKNNTVLAKGRFKIR